MEDTAAVEVDVAGIGPEELVLAAKVVTAAHRDYVEEVAAEAHYLHTDCMAGKASLSARDEAAEAWESATAAKEGAHREVEGLWVDVGHRLAVAGRLLVVWQVEGYGEAI